MYYSIRITFDKLNGKPWAILLTAKGSRICFCWWMICNVSVVFLSTIRFMIELNHHIWARFVQPPLPILRTLTHQRCKQKSRAGPVEKTKSSLLSSEDRWMYPYQHTPMENLYISPILRVYLLVKTSPRIPRQHQLNSMVDNGSFKDSPCTWIA